MCGRYAFFSPAESVRTLFGVDVPLEIAPRYNIAPTQYVPAVRAGDGHGRALAMLHWGLVPFWAKDRTIGNRLINARAETLAEKPSFRNALRKRRCLVLADGFYEWRSESGARQPYFIRRKDGQPFAMAGLWERWEKEGDVLESCTIVTTEANAFMRPLHHRMPAILPESAQAAWLAVDEAGESGVTGLLQPLQGDLLRADRVSTRVNNPRNEGPELLTASA